MKIFSPRNVCTSFDESLSLFFLKSKLFALNQHGLRFLWSFWGHKGGMYISIWIYCRGIRLALFFLSLFLFFLLSLKQANYPSVLGREAVRMRKTHSY